MERDITKDPPLSLADAKAAWEADKANFEKARTYGHRIIAARLLGVIAPDEAERLLKEAAAAAAESIPDHLKPIAKMVSTMVQAGVPVEAASRVASMMEEAGLSPDGVTLVKLDDDGEETERWDLSPVIEGDFIGRTVGRA
jgi:hypothetical protein